MGCAFVHAVTFSKWLSPLYVEFRACITGTRIVHFSRILFVDSGNTEREYMVGFWLSSRPCAGYGHVVASQNSEREWQPCREFKLFFTASKHEHVHALCVLSGNATVMPQQLREWVRSKHNDRRRFCLQICFCLACSARLFLLPRSMLFGARQFVVFSGVSWCESFGLSSTIPPFVCQLRS